MDPFIGEIKAVPYTYAPLGWAFCNGQLLNISEYNALFILLGTTYGGDGVSTFAVPNLQSRVPIHAGQGPGLSRYTLGEASGAENVTLTSTQLPVHAHGFSVTVDATPGTTSNPTGGNFAEVQSVNESTPFDSFTVGQPTSPAQLNPAQSTVSGGSQPHTNIQPYLVVNYIIALEGIFPQQQ